MFPYCKGWSPHRPKKECSTHLNTRTLLFKFFLSNARAPGNSKSSCCCCMRRAEIHPYPLRHALEQLGCCCLSHSAWIVAFSVVTINVTVFCQFYGPAQLGSFLNLQAVNSAKAESFSPVNTSRNELSRLSRGFLPSLLPITRSCFHRGLIGATLGEFTSATKRITLSLTDFAIKKTARIMNNNHRRKQTY